MCLKQIPRHLNRISMENTNWQSMKEKTTWWVTDIIVPTRQTLPSSVCLSLCMHLSIQHVSQGLQDSLNNQTNRLHRNIDLHEYPTDGNRQSYYMYIGNVPECCWLSYQLFTQMWSCDNFVSSRNKLPHGTFYQEQLFSGHFFWICFILLNSTESLKRFSMQELAVGYSLNPTLYSFTNYQYTSWHTTKCIH